MNDKTQIVIEKEQPPRQDPVEPLKWFKVAAWVGLGLGALVLGGLALSVESPKREVFYEETTWTKQTDQEAPSVALEEMKLFPAAEKRKKVFEPLPKTIRLVEEEPDCSVEESAQELDLEQPIYSGIPGVLQTACNVYFKHNQANLDQSYLDILDVHIRYLNSEGSNRKIVIETYASPEECEEVTSEEKREEQLWELSERRGAYIQGILEAKGVNADRIEVIAYGAFSPRDEEVEPGISYETNRRALLVYRLI